MEKILHELSADALALAPASDSNAHEVASAVHLKETCVADNALGVALSCNDNFVGRRLPEGLEDVDLLINLSEGFLVHHQQKGENLRLSLFVFLDFFNEYLMVALHVGGEAQAYLKLIDLLLSSA